MGRHTQSRKKLPRGIPVGYLLFSTVCVYTLHMRISQPCLLQESGPASIQVPMANLASRLSFHLLSTIPTPLRCTTAPCVRRLPPFTKNAVTAAEDKPPCIYSGVSQHTANKQHGFICTGPQSQAGVCEGAFGEVSVSGQKHISMLGHVRNTTDTTPCRPSVHGHTWDSS